MTCSGRGGRELELTKERLGQALPGELKRLQRGISLQEGKGAAQRFMLAEQERLSRAMAGSQLHARYSSLSPYVVAPDQMWAYYEGLKPGEMHAVYSYQLAREQFAFIEWELGSLDGDAVQQQEVNSKDSVGGRPSISFDRPFHDLFLIREEADSILATLRRNNIVNGESEWIGTNGQRNEVTALAAVIKMKEYLKPCSSGEIARAFNGMFKTDIDSSAYRKEPGMNIRKFYRKLIPNR